MSHQLRATLHKLFPAHCLHCKERTEGSRLYCDGCAPFFMLHTPKRTTKATVFDTSPQTLSFVKRLNRLPYLQKTAAEFLLLQFTAQKWPKPTAILPAPERGLTGPKKPIAKHLSHFLNIPLTTLSKNHTGQTLLLIDTIRTYEHNLLLHTLTPDRTFSLTLLDLTED